jgi:hypothetical protein
VPVALDAFEAADASVDWLGELVFCGGVGARLSEISMLMRSSSVRAKELDSTTSRPA